MVNTAGVYIVKQQQIVVCHRRLDFCKHGRGQYRNFKFICSPAIWDRGNSMSTDTIERPALKKLKSMFGEVDRKHLFDKETE